VERAISQILQGESAETPTKNEMIARWRRVQRLAEELRTALMEVELPDEGIVYAMVSVAAYRHRRRDGSKHTSEPLDNDARTMTR